ncbi:hypothetical protein [Clostridium tertium]|uniref:Proteins of 100 residues with WXG n=1 Tax=Clostridium tertium TaxID=1559 RepID=A0A6N3A6I8_9CLOT
MSEQVNKLDTSELKEASKQIRTMIEELTNSKNDIETATTQLLSTWVGESRNAFENKYTVLNRAIIDIEETLYDFYDSLVESEAAYIEADREVSRAIDQAREG